MYNAIVPTRIIDNEEAELKLLRERIEDARMQKGMRASELMREFGGFTEAALAMEVNPLLHAMVSKDNDLILCYFARTKENLALAMIEKTDNMVSPRGVLYLNIILNKMYTIDDDTMDIRQLEKAYGYVGKGSWNRLSWILENKGRMREDSEYDGSSYEEEEAALPKGVFAYKGDIQANRDRDLLDLANFRNNEIGKMIAISLEEGDPTVRCKVIGNTLFATKNMFPDAIYTDGKPYTLVIPDDKWDEFNLSSAFCGVGKEIEIMGTGYWWGQSPNRAYKYLKTEERMMTLLEWKTRKLSVKPLSLAQYGWRKAEMHDLHEFQLRLDFLQSKLQDTGDKLKDVRANAHTLDKIDGVIAKMAVIEEQLRNPDRWSKTTKGDREVPVFDFQGNHEKGYKTVGVQGDVAENEVFSLIVDAATGIYLGVVYLDPAFIGNNTWAEIEPTVVNDKLRVKATFVEEPDVVEEVKDVLPVLEGKKAAARNRLAKIKAML